MLFLTPVEDIIYDLPDGGVVSYHQLIIWYGMEQGLLKRMTFRKQML